MNLNSGPLGTVCTPVIHEPSCLPVARSHKLISLSSELVQENVSPRFLEPSALYLQFLVSGFQFQTLPLVLLSLYVEFGRLWHKSNRTLNTNKDAG